MQTCGTTTPATRRTTHKRSALHCGRMAQPSCSCEGSAIEGRQRERESSFPMVPVDEAIGEVLKQASTLEAVTVKLADIPAGDDMLAH